MKKNSQHIPKTYRIAAVIGLVFSLVLLFYASFSKGWGHNGGQFGFQVLWTFIQNSGPFGFAGWGGLVGFVVFSVVSAFKKKFRINPDLFFGLAQGVLCFFILTCVILGAMNAYGSAEGFNARVLMLAQSYIEMLFQTMFGMILLWWAISLYIFRCQRKPTFGLCFFSSIIFTFVTVVLLFSIPFFVIFRMAGIWN